MKRLMVALSLLGVVSCGGAGEGNFLSPYGNSNLQMREYETKELAFRLQDKDGYPVVGGAVRIRTEGMTNNAVVETVVARADQQGVARTNIRAGFEANFVIVAEADGAMPVQVPVSVAKANGGSLQVMVYSRAAASATQAQITLVNNIACTTFDPRMPPAAAAGVPNATQTAAVSSSGSPVQFVGLTPGQQYAVVAIATANGYTVAKGCQDNLSITQQEVEQKVPRQASVYLEDFSTDISGNALLVETNFNYPLHLVRVANLLKEMSDSPSDPLDFIIDRSLASGDYWTSLLGNVVKDQMMQYVQAQTPQSQLTRAKIQQVYQALANVTDVKLYTTFKINDETAAGQGQLTALHTFRYFSANVGGLQQKYFLKDGVNLFGDSPPAMTLEAEAKVTLEDASRVRIEKHTLSLPIAEAIIGTLLVDTFNEYSLKAVFTSMVDCSGVADAVANYYNTWRAGATSLERSAIRTGMQSACKSVLADMAVDVYNDIRKDISDSGYGTEITLEGSANIGMLADGKTIGQMTNGQWLGVGTFSASRY